MNETRLRFSARVSLIRPTSIFFFFFCDQGCEHTDKRLVTILACGALALVVPSFALPLTALYVHVLREYED